MFFFLHRSPVDRPKVCATEFSPHERRDNRKVATVHKVDDTNLHIPFYTQNDNILIFVVLSIFSIAKKNSKSYCQQQISFCRDLRFLIICFTKAGTDTDTYIYISVYIYYGYYGTREEKVTHIGNCLPSPPSLKKTLAHPSFQPFLLLCMCGMCILFFDFFPPRFCSSAF